MTPVTGARWILSLSCVSGDEVQVAIHRQDDVAQWLKRLDHEGSNWSITDMQTQKGYGPEEWHELSTHL